MKPEHQNIAAEFESRVLEPMKRAFVGKDEVIDLLGVSLIARENLFILGPPGTAKSALVQDMARRIEGKVFDYLLTRFTEPNEIFGPFDIRKLRDGELVTNTEGMLPEATFVFLDELLNANSAILNSLLMVLNERVFRRGRESRSLPTLMVVGASNQLPEDDALGALFDRFLLRVNCVNVDDDQLGAVLKAGWSLEQQVDFEPAVTVQQIQTLQNLIKQVDFEQVLPIYIQTIQRLRLAGIQLSDRRAVKLQRMLAASSILCGRSTAIASDMWVLRYIWDTVEEQGILNSLVSQAIESDNTDQQEEHKHHRQSQSESKPDPEQLSRDMDALIHQLSDSEISTLERSQCRDRVSLIAAKFQWIDDETQRSFLQEKMNSIWKLVEVENAS
ncbi:MAG: AAA family ATPase [Planctomycetota bacterium]